MASYSAPGRTGWAWRKLRAEILAESYACHLCGQPLRPDVPNPLPMSSVIDHLVPIVEGGAPMDRANLAAAHRACNGRKESLRQQQRRRQRDLNTSRDW